MQVVEQRSERLMGEGGYEELVEFWQAVSLSLFLIP